jgi:hypothetical protein
MMRKPNDPAIPLDAESRRQIEEQELLGVLLEERPGDEKRGVISTHPPRILQRLRFPLECLGGILLGVNIAVTAILFNFILFNYLLHIDF